MRNGYLLSILLACAVLLAACSSREVHPAGPRDGAVWVQVTVPGACAPVAPDAAPAPVAPPAPVCKDGKCYIPSPATYSFVSEGPYGEAGAVGVPAPIATHNTDAPAYLGWLVLALLILTAVLSLNGKRRLAIVPVAALVAIACAGCRVGDALVGSLPASSAYVDELHAGQDKALADLRTHVDASDAKIRTDVEAADAAGREAFDKALAEGRSLSEALAAQIVAKAESATRTAQEAKDAAAKASTDATAGAAEAVAKAKEVAQDESGGGTPWWASLVGLLGGGGGLALFMRKMLTAFDAQPFVGPNGERVPEAQLVAASLKQPAA